jgi:hypothetical protein
MCFSNVFVLLFWVPSFLMLFFIHCSALVLLCFLFGFLCFKVSWHAYDDVSVCPDLYYSFIKNEWWSWTLWGTGMSKQANFHTCLFYSVFLVRKSYFSRLWIWPLCHTIFVHRWSCDMWLLVVRVVVCRSVYDMWGRENYLIFGVSCRLSFSTTPFAAIIWLP